MADSWNLLADSDQHRQRCWCVSSAGEGTRPSNPPLRYRCPAACVERRPSLHREHTHFCAPTPVAAVQLSLQLREVHLQLPLHQVQARFQVHGQQELLCVRQGLFGSSGSRAKRPLSGRLLPGWTYTAAACNVAYLLPEVAAAEVSDLAQACRTWMHLDANGAMCVTSESCRYAVNHAGSFTQSSFTQEDRHMHSLAAAVVAAPTCWPLPSLPTRPAPEPAAAQWLGLLGGCLQAQAQQAGEQLYEHIGLGQSRAQLLQLGCCRLCRRLKRCHERLHP